MESALRGLAPRSGARSHPCHGPARSRGDLRVGGQKLPGAAQQAPMCGRSAKGHAWAPGPPPPTAGDRRCSRVLLAPGPEPRRPWEALPRRLVWRLGSPAGRGRAGIRARCVPVSPVPGKQQAQRSPESKWLCFPGAASGAAAGFRSRPRAIGFDYPSTRKMDLSGGHSFWPLVLQAARQQAGGTRVANSTYPAHAPGGDSDAARPTVPGSVTRAVWPGRRPRGAVGAAGAQRGGPTGHVVGAPL